MPRQQRPGRAYPRGVTNELLPASYDLLWTSALVLVVVVVPGVLALVGYVVVRLALRHELARRDRLEAARAVPAGG